MSVQDAAYSMISIVRAGYASLNDTEFHYLPVARTSLEGYYTGFYADAAHKEPLLRTTTEMLEERDRENCTLRMELYNTRQDHCATLTRLAPAVHTCYLDMCDLYLVRTRLPACMDYADVGGITPPHGCPLPPFVGLRPHPSPYGPQSRRDREFSDPHVSLPGYVWDFCEDNYRSGDDLAGLRH